MLSAAETSAGSAMHAQANAEPDLRQTGDRLKGLIAGLVEVTLDLVAGPLEQQQQQQQHQAKQVLSMPQVSGGRVGSWIKVFEKRQDGRGLGGSGMHML